MKTAFEQHLENKLLLEARAEKAAAEMKKFPKLPDGRHSDAVKALPEFQAAKTAFGFAFIQLQNYNKFFVRTYQKEYAEYMQAKRKQT